MLVHPSIMNISHFSTQIFARNQAIQDVCTEPNNIKKKSIFITVWSLNSLSQKFILQPKVTVTWRLSLSVALITPILCFFLPLTTNSNHIVSKLLSLLILYLFWCQKPTRYVSLWTIWSGIAFLLVWHILVMLDIRC